MYEKIEQKKRTVRSWQSLHMVFQFVKDQGTQTIRAVGNMDYLAMPDHGMPKFIGCLLFLVRTRSGRIETIIVMLLTMYLHPILMNIGPSHDNGLMSGLMDLTCISRGDIAGQGPSGHSGRNIDRNETRHSSFWKG